MSQSQAEPVAGGVRFRCGSFKGSGSTVVATLTSGGSLRSPRGRTGAEAVLNLGALLANSDCEEYRRFHHLREKGRIRRPLTSATRFQATTMSLERSRTQFKLTHYRPETAAPIWLRIPGHPSPPQRYPVVPEVSGQALSGDSAPYLSHQTSPVQNVSRRADATPATSRRRWRSAAGVKRGPAS